MEVAWGSCPVQLVSLAYQPPAVCRTVMSSLTVDPAPKSRTTWAIAPGLPSGSGVEVIVRDWYVFWQRQRGSAGLSGFESSRWASPSVTGQASYLPSVPQTPPLGGKRIPATTAAPLGSRFETTICPLTTLGEGMGVGVGEGAGVAVGVGLVGAPVMGFVQAPKDSVRAMSARPRRRMSTRDSTPAS